MNRSLLVGVLLVWGCGDNIHMAHDTLVRIDNEPPGMNCQYGGVAIQTGHDQNQNETLEDSEILSTQYVCNGMSVVKCHGGGTVLKGNVVVRNAADFDQLANVRCLDGDLIVAGLAGELPALPDLYTVTGGVTIAGNPDLTSLAFTGLREVGQSYLVQGNDSLTDVASLADLDTVLSIFLVGNDSLQDLAGFSSEHQLTTKLTVSNNPNLTSLHGLENIVSAQSWIVVRSNRSLTDVSALQGLKTVGAMEISGNHSLTSLSLPELDRVDLRLTVTANPALTAFAAPKLATLSDGITVSGNPQLSSINLHGLLTTGILTIDNNASLKTIDASSFSFVTVDLVIANMTQLQTANFGSLNSVGGTLKFVNVSPLSFSGFSKLERVGSLWLSGSGNTDFAGLTSFTDIAGDMTVTGNPNVTSFNGLDQMTTIGGNLTITNNASLSSNTAHAFANNVLVGGTVTIN